ncbi:MAG: PDZ domain-containing protein [Pyrinomonadaceae bacterium]
MLNRVLSSVMIVTSAFTIIIGQTAPETKKDAEKSAQTFAFTFVGDGGYLGVQTLEVTKENFGKFGLREVRGVAVEKVMENSPAAAAGLREGDVIVRFDGDAVTSTRKLTRLIGEVDPDHQVKLTISRGGSEQEIAATVGKRQAPAFGEGNFKMMAPDMIEKFNFEKFRNLPTMKDLPQIFGMPDAPDAQSFTWRGGEGRQIGISVYPVTKQLGERYGVDGGVMINDVHENTPAAKAGLKAGDVVTEIDGKPVKNQLDLIRAINSKKDGDVTVTIMRDRSRQTISVTPEVSKSGGFFYQSDGQDGVFLPRVPSAPMRTSPLIAPTPMRAPAPARTLMPKRFI